MIATGRSWEGTRGILRVLNIAPEFVVCSNGAVVLRRLDADELQLRALPHRDVRPDRGADAAARRTCPTRSYLVELPDGQPPLHRLPRGLEPRARQARALRRARRAAGVPHRRRLARARASRTSSTSSPASGSNQVSYAVGWTAWLDIAPQGVDKSTGLELRARRARHRPRARARDRRRPQRRRHVPLGARERRSRGRDGAGSARGSGCRGRDHRVGRRPGGVAEVLRKL